LLSIIRRYQFATVIAGESSGKKWRIIWQGLVLEKKARKEKYADCKLSEATNVEANMKQISNKEGRWSRKTKAGS